MRARGTIVALSSGALPAGLAVLRISGSQTRAILERFAGGVPAPRRLLLRPIGDGVVIDTGLVAFMPGPQSFTGDDTAELQVHGSPAVVRRLLRDLTSVKGVRLAEPGEFTRRAFLNGKLDLTAVEGLGDLIAAETESQRLQAAARLAGGLAGKVENWREVLMHARAEIEARLDFSDEGDVSDDVPDAVRREIAELRGEVQAALAGFAQGRIVREGFRVALAGPPNAGKSSLLNALAKSDLAIVSDEAGTTRDVKEVALDLGGQLVVFVDMAGLRETASRAEAEGVRRARAEIQRADLVLWLVAADVPADDVPEVTSPVWKIGSKSDLGAVAADHVVSAATGKGVGELMAAIAEFAGTQTSSAETLLVSRERDRAALALADEALGRFLALGGEGELAAEELRAASQALERLVGRLDAEDILDRLFASFCIGK